MPAQIVELVDLRSVRVLRFENAEQIAEKIIALFDKFEFDVCTLFYSRFRSVIAQIPTAQQIIPPVFDTKAADALGGAVYEFEPDAEDILARASAAQPRGADFPGACWKMPPRSTARRCRRWTMRRAMPAT